MRIGFDGRWYNDSGVGTYVAELLQALACLQSRSTSGQKPFELFVYEDPKNPLPQLPPNPLGPPRAAFARHGMGVTRIPLSSGKYSLAAQLELRKCCQRDRLDIFHSPFYPIPLRASCPVVVTIHDLIPFLFRTENPLKQFIVKCGYRIAAARSSRIIAVSRHTAGDITRILRISQDKITAVHNGLGHDFHPTQTPKEAEYLEKRYGIRPPYVVAASTRNWQTKNLPSALETLRLARKRSKLEFHTVVYGPSNGLTASGGADGWTDLNPIQTGHLPAAELAKVFRNALLFMMPTLYEGFGLAVAEAMACGCAVITSNAGSLPEVAGDGAQLFAPKDISGMAEAATRLLCDAAERKRCQQLALRRAAGFSWSRAAQETLAVYDQAINDEIERR